MISPDPVVPFWLTVFLDYPPAELEAGVRFWRSGTGYSVSHTRGTANEFATLVPPAGDDYLRVQRLGDGHTGLHLDLHVGDPRAAATAAQVAGAQLVAEPTEGNLVLSSPAGFAFCLVTKPATTVPPPITWPSGHHSRVSQFCLDVPRTQYAAEVRFFRTLLGGEWAELDEPKTALLPAGSRAFDVRLQPAELATSVTAHLHIATDDLSAEVSRLSALGARARGARPGKTILEAPGGTALCVVAAERDERM
ncbi:MAG: VOC family protein [Propionicimonas sp.]